MKNILIIKLGALGDFVHAFHAFEALRQHHAKDRLTLLTTPPFRAMAERSGWFDQVIALDRRPWWDVLALLRTRKALRGYDFVYDLQTSSRSARYFRLAGRPPWNGIAPGCSHPHDAPNRRQLHSVDRLKEQIRVAGVTDFPPPRHDWLLEERGLAPDTPYALLMPGGAGVGAVKRWPAENYAALAAALMERGLRPVIIGGKAEESAAAAILAACPEALDLTMKTSFFDIATLAAGARLLVGNDTGPMHLAACMGPPAIALFSAAGVPAKHAPRGPAGEWSTVIQEADLKNLPVAKVLETVETLLAATSVSLNPIQAG
ncbi:glycosyltransferase family 9 protein [Acetobacteraceae bacterium H6797]|nr:glycosyltransferase family 9 protein [Acetobacteraceae bacterium H6797]